MALHIKFKNQGQERTALILKNRGITWLVRDCATGEEYQVQKKLVIESFEAPEKPLEPSCPACGAQGVILNEEGYCADCASAATDQEEHADPTSLLGQLGAAAHAPEPALKKERKPREKKESAPRDPNLVSLKELCFQLEIEPRIARRMLRKAQGNIGTGSRWEWTKDSDDLAKVRTILLKAE